jgi:hypothetical protein
MNGCDFLKLKPVNRIKKPLYPDKEYVTNNLDVLSQIPFKWKSDKYLAALCSLLLVTGLTGCKDSSEVAPIFKHGSGYYYNLKIVELHNMYTLARAEGITLKLKPPAYAINEDKAVSMINDLLADEGIYIDSTNEETGVIIQNVNEILDGYSTSLKIGYEFISCEDGYKLGGNNLYSFDTFKTAIKLRLLLKGVNNERYIGIFYDPLKTETVKSEKFLEKQVKDFIRWLKVQGAL